MLAARHRSPSRAGRSCALAGFLCLAGLRAASAGVCNPVAIGVDTARADTSELAYYCRGQAQVFEAQDTLIHSISTWEPLRSWVDFHPRYLFITEVYSE